MRLRRIKILPKPEWNNTTRFLLPVLKLNIGVLTKNGFVNSYVSDHEHEELYDKHLYLLFNPVKFTKDFDHFCSIMQKHELFEEEYDCRGNYGRVMFVFRIPEKFIEILDKFKRGEYSKFPKEYIENYFSKVTPDGQLSTRWKIFHKDPELRKEREKQLSVEGRKGHEVKLDESAELWSIPKESEEIYNYNPNIDAEQWTKNLKNIST